jgi:hypothetical protein
MSRHFATFVRPNAPAKAEPVPEKPAQASDKTSDNDVQIARYLSTTAERLANLSDRPTHFKITTVIKRVDGLITSVESTVRPMGE